MTHTQVHSLTRRSRTVRSRAREGFSLIELMIVVTITGILAAIAIPSFASYVYRSRTSEATQFLGVIKLKQEAFRSEFGQYLQYNVAPNGTGGIQTLAGIVFIPAGVATMRDSVTAAFPNNDQWFNQLGARPDSAVRFGYGWAAGLPGTGPGVLGFCDAGNPPPCVPQDHWFAAQAVSDLDGQATTVVFELSSVSRNIWIGHPDGITCERGWE